MKGELAAFDLCTRSSWHRIALCCSPADRGKRYLTFSRDRQTSTRPRVQNPKFCIFFAFFLFGVSRWPCSAALPLASSSGSGGSAMLCSAFQATKKKKQIRSCGRQASYRRKGMPASPLIPKGRLSLPPALHAVDATSSCLHDGQASVGDSRARCGDEGRLARGCNHVG